MKTRYDVYVQYQRVALILRLIGGDTGRFVREYRAAVDNQARAAVVAAWVAMLDDGTHTMTMEVGSDEHAA